MVRVPVDFLGVNPGQLVNAFFEGTRIIIEPVAVATA
jgi:virulence-associated protein VagC